MGSVQIESRGGFRTTIVFNTGLSLNFLVPVQLLVKILIN